jgi:hypothetical protein
MSALDQKQTCAVQKVMSALPPIATSIAFFGMSALGQKRTSEQDWFVSYSEVLAFLGRSNVVPEFATSTENTKTEEVATLASSFTVQIICHR